MRHNKDTKEQIRLAYRLLKNKWRPQTVNNLVEDAHDACRLAELVLKFYKVQEPK